MQVPKGNHSGFAGHEPADEQGAGSCPAGNPLCQNSEWQEPTLIDEPNCPAGGSLCQNSEWPKPTLIDERKNPYPHDRKLYRESYGIFQFD